MRSLIVLLAISMWTARADAKACDGRSACRVSPSFAGAFVVRFVPMPSLVDVCVRSGKSCRTVGTFEADSKPGTQQTPTAVLAANALSIGPFRLGIEMGIGGSQGGIAGRYEGIHVRTSEFLFVSGAFTGGFVFAIGRLGFRFDGLAGVSGFSGDIGLKNEDGKALKVNFSYPQLEGRGTVFYHATPRISVGALAGYGLGEVWHAGGIVRFTWDPWDGAL